MIPYFFGLHSRANFWASNSWAGVITLATLSRLLTSISRSSPGGYYEDAVSPHRTLRRKARVMV